MVQFECNGEWWNIIYGSRKKDTIYYNNSNHEYNDFNKDAKEKIQYDHYDNMQPTVKKVSQKGASTACNNKVCKRRRT